MAKRAFSQICSRDENHDCDLAGESAVQASPPKARRKLTNGSLPKERSAKGSEGSYVLSRNYAATTRLNCQFFLWKIELGYSLHPSILPSPSSKANNPTTNGATLKPEGSYPSPSESHPDDLLQPDNPSTTNQPTLRIADLATGTAIWPLDIARTFPNAQVDGSDISLKQSPPAEWLPKNVSLSELDIYSDLPEKWRGIYDVVHLRLLLLVIRGNDPRPVLRNALKMLKPRGWIQWDELDPWGAYTISTTDIHHSVPEKCSDGQPEKQFQRKQELTAMSTLTWVTQLHEIMQEVGFEDIRREEIPCNVGLAKYYQDMQFLVMEEEAANKGTKEEREKVERAIAEGVAESQEGRARVTPKVVVLGRKPRVTTI